MPPENENLPVPGRAAKLAGAGVSGALLVWLVTQLAANESAHTKVHQDMAKDSKDMAVAIARLEARLSFHHGEPTPREAAVEAAAEVTALAEVAKPPRP